MLDAYDQDSKAKVLKSDLDQSLRKGPLTENDDLAILYLVYVV